jgi:hypothetical protein
MTKPKIWIFLQATSGGLQQWVAIAESGACLASEMLKAKLMPAVMAKLGPLSKNAATYKEHYPDGYDLEYIEDINAPENWQVLQDIRKATDNFVLGHVARGFDKVKQAMAENRLKKVRKK